MTDLKIQLKRARFWNRTKNISTNPAYFKASLNNEVTNIENNFMISYKKNEI